MLTLREVALVVALVIAVIGLVVQRQETIGKVERSTDTIEDAKKTWRPPGPSDMFGEAGERILDEILPKKIETYLRYLTLKGHMAGSIEELEQAEYIRDLWLEQGLDEAYLQRYEVLMSYPDRDKPNKVYLLDEAGNTKFTSSIFEESLDGKDYDPSIPPAYLAFAAAGTVTSDDLVYVNYGTYEDYKSLQEKGMDFGGKVVIVRIGTTFRGDKVKNAERFGAAAAILYTDPAEYNPDMNDTNAFPNAFWLPGSGIQRGSIIMHDGDPSTPYFPSLEGVHRVPEETYDLPSIPAHVISYNDARKLLVLLGGPVAPADWQGRLDINYHIGPGFKNPGWSVRVEVNSVLTLRPTYNVIGVLLGDEEPDRYVMLGNHRDSWTYGAMDPSSGTAAMMELARAMASLKKKGWRPRRTIVFAAWGAAEQGFLGSTEMVEEHLKTLDQRAVAYLNVDLAVFGTYNMIMTGTPILNKVLVESMRKTPSPDPSLGFASLFDLYMGRFHAGQPDVIAFMLGSVSDHAPFYQRVGVPVASFCWGVNYGELLWSDYPLYHSTFEEFDSVKNIIDPDFKYHVTLAQMWGLMAIGLSDNLVLPMDPYDETLMYDRIIEETQTGYGDLLEKYSITLETLKKKMREFGDVAGKFNENVKQMVDVSDLKARQLNDQLMLLEKCYIDSSGKGVLNTPHYKNMLIGPDKFDQYHSWLAPGLQEALWVANECDKSTDGKKISCHDHIEEIKQQISILTAMINSAVLALQNRL